MRLVVCSLAAFTFAVAAGSKVSTAEGVLGAAGLL